MNLTVILGADGAGRRRRRLLVGPHGPTIGGPRQPLRRIAASRRPARSRTPSSAGWARPLAGCCPIHWSTGWKSSSCRPGTPTGSICHASSASRSSWPALAAFMLLLVGQPLFALVAAGLLFFLPDYWVLSTRDKRQAAMQAKAADTIDQLTICVEAGLGLDAALARVATTTEGPLTDELRHTISDIQAGVPRAQALRTLADRAQIPEIRQLVTALLQAQKHGVPMAETLRIQSSEMRLKRKQRTEEKAAKLTVKMLFPIIVCYLPVFMIITVVPALITSCSSCSRRQGRRGAVGSPCRREAPVHGTGAFACPHGTGARLNADRAVPGVLATACGRPPLCARAVTFS